MFDTFGVLALVGLIVIFSFLAFRAWKLGNALLKWSGVVISGLLTLVPTALLVLALIGFAKLNTHYDNPVSSLQVAGTPAQISRGEKLAYACLSCHASVDELPLSGTNFAVKFGLPPLGTLYAPNLTPAGNLQDWSDGEIIRAIREGIHKNGRSLLIMPSAGFRNLSDEDVQAVVAYLRAQPSVGAPTPTNGFNVLGAIFTNLVDFRVAQPAVANVVAPPPGTPEYGKYMVDIIGCRDCHGAQLQGKIDDGAPGPPPGPNLTAMIPHWTEEQFMTFFNTGTLPGGGTVPLLTLPSGYSEPKMPWPTVRAVASDDDLKDMYAYLHNLPLEQSPTR